MQVSSDGAGPRQQVGEMERNGQCEISSKGSGTEWQNMLMDSVLENVRTENRKSRMVRVFDVNNQAGGGSTAELRTESGDGQTVQRLLLAMLTWRRSLAFS